MPSHLSFHTKVAGVTFEDPDSMTRQDAISMCAEGEELLLLREPSNPFDPNAIGVFRTSGERLGYIPRSLAAELAAEIDGGKTFYAFISALTGGTEGRPTRGVNIEIYGG